MNKQEIEKVINILSYLAGYEKAARESGGEFGEPKLENDELEALEKSSGTSQAAINRWMDTGIIRKITGRGGKIYCHT